MSETSLTGRTHRELEVRIEPTSGWRAVSLKELWDYREVVFFLAWRDIKVQYKQTIFGFAWAVFQPLMAMVIFSVIFGKVAKIPSDGIPYPIFSYAALVPWYFFANSITKASNSLVGGGNILKQIYFPRLAMPLSAVLANCLDFALAFTVLLVMMAFYGIVPTANVVWLPALLLLALGAALGVSFILTAMNVQFRDVRHAMTFLVQAWMFATPVVYPSSLIEDPFWHAMYSLNPMVGVIEGFRWALLGTDTAPDTSILISVAVSICLLVVGTLYFKRMERTFADVV
ncbi:MAG: ABC transporter permease [Pseudomonadales bacterium]